MKGLDWDRFLNHEIYVYCKSKEDLKTFLSQCDTKDIGWYGGGEKITASRNRTFNRFNHGDCYFQYSVGHIWSVSKYIRDLSMKETITFTVSE